MNIKLRSHGRSTPYTSTQEGKREVFSLLFLNKTRNLPTHVFPLLTPIAREN